MNPKISFTLYDTMSLLIPGVLVLSLIPSSFHLFSPTEPLLLLTYYVVVGFVMGSVLSALGTILFTGFYEERSKPKLAKLIKIIDNIILLIPTMRIKRIDSPVKDLLIERIHKKYTLDYSKDRLGLFSFCDIYTSAHNYAERDILLAKEGFYRTLTAAIIVITTWLLWQPKANYLLILIVCTGATTLTRYAREYYRIIKNQHIYTFTYQHLQDE